MEQSRQLLPLVREEVAVPGTASVFIHEDVHKAFLVKLSQPAFD